MIGSLLRILASLTGLPAALAGWWGRLREKRQKAKIVRQEERIKELQRNSVAKIKALEAEHKVKNEAKNKPIGHILDYLRRGGK